MTTISLKLPDALATRLDALARRRRVSRSELVREALTALVEGGSTAPSVGDLAGDLVGSLEGPGDLSTNKQRMRGFGR